MTKLEDVKSI